MNRWLASHQAISSAPSATSRCGWVSCACTNGVMTLSASWGPIRTPTAPLAASSACGDRAGADDVLREPERGADRDRRGHEGQHREERHLGRVAGRAVPLAARQTSTSVPTNPSLGSASTLHRAADWARSVICRRGTPMTRGSGAEPIIPQAPRAPGGAGSARCTARGRPRGSSSRRSRAAARSTPGRARPSRTPPWRRRRRSRGRGRAR